MGVEGDKGDGKKKADGQQDHNAALQADAYTAKLNTRVMNNDGTIKHGQCSEGISLYKLTIDTEPGHVIVHDVPKVGANAQERREAAHRTMPISNEHFRELVQKGTEFLMINGGFNLQMKNALDEANQSDKSMKTKHEHVDDVLKYANAKLCDTFYTLTRKGNIVEIWDTHSSTSTPAGRWNLDKKDYVH